MYTVDDYIYNISVVLFQQISLAGLRSSGRGPRQRLHATSEGGGLGWELVHGGETWPM